MAKFDSGLVKVERWVIHEVPKTFRREEVTPRLSEAESPFDAEVARFFERKISDSFGRSRHEVGPLADAETPAALLSRLDRSNDLISTSIALGTRLHGAQSGAMSGGLLVVMDGHHGEKPLVAVLKLEKEEGARASSAEVEGKSTYSVEYLKDLFLTGRTRVFKVAVFMEEEGTLRGWASDPQSKGSEVADFFLEAFLECRLLVEPRLITKEFHAEAERFFNESVGDPATRSRYETALIAELQRNASEVDANSFATNHLAVADRQPFIDHLKHADVALTFVKDLGLIRSRLTRLQYEFAAGVKVTLPSDAPEGLVEIDALEDGRTRLQVLDDLSEVRSRG